MKKLKFIKSFESFILKDVTELINFNKTYIRKNKILPFLISEDDFDIIYNKILSYDVNNFIYKETPYDVFIYPDDDFKNLLSELNKTIDPKISVDIDFYITVDKDNLNQIDFTEGIPTILRGTGLGYKLYKLIIKNFGFITTNKYSTILSYNVWYKLMIDKELYCYTSNFYSGVIYKKISDEKIKNFLDKIRNMELIFDSELEQKIIELYGSMDIYKQKNK